MQNGTTVQYIDVGILSASYAYGFLKLHFITETALVCPCLSQIISDLLDDKVHRCGCRDAAPRGDREANDPK